MAKETLYIPGTRSVTSSRGQLAVPVYDYLSGLHTDPATIITNQYLPQLEQDIDLDHSNPQKHDLYARFIKAIETPSPIKSDIGSDIEILRTGSSSEGLSVPRTIHFYNEQKNKTEITDADWDIMVINVADEVCDDEPITKPSGKFVFVTNGENVHPGYTRLISVLSEKPLSSMGFKWNFFGVLQKSIMEPLINSIADSYTHLTDFSIEDSGAAITLIHDVGPDPSNTKSLDKIARLDIDIVLAQHSRKWPSVAERWLKRPRASGWPSQSMMTAIASKGAYIICKPHPLSHDPDHEWRYSFSLAEKALAASFNAVHVKCYILMKILVRRIAAPPKVVSSYFIKTSMFWLCEKVPHEEWNYSTSFQRFLELLDQVIYFLSSGKLPNYFIPENNMVDHIPREHLRTSLQKLIGMRKDPIQAFRYVVLMHHSLKTSLFTIIEPLVTAARAVTPPNNQTMVKTYYEIEQNKFKAFINEGLSTSATTVCTDMASTITPVLLHGKRLTAQELIADWSVRLWRQLHADGMKWEKEDKNTVAGLIGIHRYMLQAVREIQDDNEELELVGMSELGSWFVYCLTMKNYYEEQREGDIMPGFVISTMVELIEETMKIMGQLEGLIQVKKEAAAID